MQPAGAVTEVKGPGRVEHKSNAGFVSAETTDGTLRLTVNNFELNTLAPEGYSLVGSEYNRCDHDGQKVEVAVKNIESEGFVLDALHEISHAVGDSREDVDREKEITELLKHPPASDDEFFGVLKEYTGIVERRERGAILGSLELATKAREESGYDVRRNFKDSESLIQKIINDHKGYRSGMKYYAERTLRGDDEHHQVYKAGVDQIFAPGAEELRQKAQEFWDS